jgi:hypothetical protein
MRRSVLRLLGLGVFMPDARASRGRGGTQPPSPYAPAAPTQTAVTPGTSGPVVRARQVIVSGPGVDGVFVYNGTPAAGNPPVAWVTSGTTDPYGNSLPDSGIVSAGSSAGPYSALRGGSVQVLAHGQVEPGGMSSAGNGSLLVSSGGQTASDGEAGIVLSSSDFTGGTSQAALVADAVQLTATASLLIPQPAPGATAADIIAALQAVGIFS